MEDVPGLFDCKPGHRVLKRLNAKEFWMMRDNKKDGQLVRAVLNKIPALHKRLKEEYLEAIGKIATA